MTPGQGVLLPLRYEVSYPCPHTPSSWLQAFSSFSSWSPSPNLLFSVGPSVELVAKNSFSRRPYHYHLQAGFPPMDHCPSTFPLIGWVFSLDTPIQKMKVSYLPESLNFLMTLMVKVLKCHRFLSHFVLHSPRKYF